MLLLYSVAIADGSWSDNTGLGNKSGSTTSATTSIQRQQGSIGCMVEIRDACHRERLSAKATELLPLFHPTPVLCFNLTTQMQVIHNIPRVKYRRLCHQHNKQGKFHFFFPVTLVFPLFTYFAQWAVNAVLLSNKEITTLISWLHTPHIINWHPLYRLSQFINYYISWVVASVTYTSSPQTRLKCIMLFQNAKNENLPSLKQFYGQGLKIIIRRSKKGMVDHTP